MKSISIYRINAILLFIILTGVLLYYGRSFLIPVCFSVLLVMLFLPVSRKLESWGLGRIAAILVCLLLLLLFFGIVIGILGTQAANFSEDLPLIQSQSQQLLEALQNKIQELVGVSPQQQINYLQRAIRNFSASANSFITSALSGTVGFLTGLVLTLLYFFFLMWKREKFQEFFLKLVNNENRPVLKKELNEITQVASQYLIGRLISMLFLATVYAIGFSIVGLMNGVLLGFVAVLPTIVPYVGAYIGGFFPLVMTLVTGSGDMLLPVILILVIAQTIDNNIIELLVEGQSLNLSPIWTIVALVLGEMFWGVAGMILFIPMFAVLKIICDHIPALHPYSFLLANDVDEPKWIEKLKKLFKKKT